MKPIIPSPDDDMASLNEVGNLLMHLFIKDCMFTSVVGGFDKMFDEWVNARLQKEDIAGYPSKLVATEIKRLFIERFDRDFLKPLM